MKLAEDKKLEFLSWLAETHEDDLRRHSLANTQNPWWEKRAPYSVATSAILSTGRLYQLFVDWGKQSGVANSETFADVCATHKAITGFIRSKVCKEAEGARIKGQDKHTPSGIVSEYFLHIKGGMDCFLSALKKAVEEEQQRGPRQCSHARRRENRPPVPLSEGTEERTPRKRGASSPPVPSSCGPAKKKQMQRTAQPLAVRSSPPQTLVTPPLQHPTPEAWPANWGSSTPQRPKQSPSAPRGCPLPTEKQPVLETVPLEGWHRAGVALHMLPPKKRYLAELPGGSNL